MTALKTAAKLQEPRLIDLSLPIDERLPVWPGDPLFATRPVACHELDGYRVDAITLGTHTGTHIDMPFHAFVDGEKSGDLPLDYFYGTAAVLDLTPVINDPGSAGTTGNAGSERDPSPEKGESSFALESRHLAPFEDILANVPRILLKTGWSSHFGQSDYYHCFPSLMPEALEYLAGFPILLLGLETPSLFADLPENLPLNLLDADHAGHRLLLGRIPPILLLESLASLESLPAYRPGQEKNVVLPFHQDDMRLFTLSCFPLPVTEADAAPARAVAIVNPRAAALS
ncbi:MAG: cyclase family protein [Planctomycetia bacterium]|nr:cyclase family protein [Planctomycetia bacterium]